jgi:hypothetical protein
MAKGNIIILKNPLNFKIPKNIIEKTWRTDFLSVFVTDSHADNKDWEMTTGCLDITVKKGDSSESAITVVHNPDLSNGESVSDFTKHTMTVKTRSVDNLSFEKGNTLPTGVKLKSKRKLIAIANRVALRLDGKVEMFLFNDDELVETWFHEIACHAGRNAQGLPDTHNDKTVNSYTTEIKEMFPETKTIPTVGAVIKEFLKA